MPCPILSSQSHLPMAPAPPAATSGRGDLISSSPCSLPVLWLLWLCTVCSFYLGTFLCHFLCHSCHFSMSLLSRLSQKTWLWHFHPGTFTGLPSSAVLTTHVLLLPHWSKPPPRPGTSQGQMLYHSYLGISRLSNGVGIKSIPAKVKSVPEGCRESILIMVKGNCELWWGKGGAQMRSACLSPLGS